MPFVRIDVSKDLSADVVERISLVIYDSMTEVANVPPNDKFQVITRHAANERVVLANQLYRHVA